MKIIGIADGDPFHETTWSGCSSFFLKALDDRGCLAAGISGNPSRYANWFHQAVNFTLPLKSWKFRYHLDTRHYQAMTRKVERELGRVREDFTHVLQIYSHYDVPSLLNGRQVVKCAFQDGNLARRLDSPLGFPRISRQRISRAMAWEKGVFGSLDHIFTFSDWLRHSFISDYGIEPRKVHVVGAGANLPPVETPERDYDCKTILFSGIHFERKGGHILLESFRQVRRALPEARLIIIGPVLSGLPPGVECPGYISKSDPQGIARIREAYQRASLFVMPSLYEPFGVVFVEAMAHRLACIGTRNCAMPEIIEEGKTGYLVPVNNPAALAERMIHLLRRPDLLRAMGNAGYQRYRSLFTWDRVAERMTTILANPQSS
jgi:alpha-maltose-1-phosphate synthase